MTQIRDTSRDMRIDPDSFAGGYFRNAVYRHWDPCEDVPQELLEQDRERLLAHDGDEEKFEALRTTLALFGAGEEAVTEDLMPLGMVLDDIDDQMFLSTQIYEEAKHTQFFDRYWREVIDPVARAEDAEVTRPTDQRYFPEGYVELFDRTEEAMERLLTDDTPENRAKAYCHYHLTVESVLAQTGYYGISARFSDGGPDVYDDDVDTPELEGLVEGINYIRSDEGRHVGFGMQKVRHLIHEERVDETVVQDTLMNLLPFVSEAVEATRTEDVDPTPLIEYATDKVRRRIDVLTERDAELPAVERLVTLEEDRDGTSAD
jgi:ribonucleoside-diphosphate reductase beta chain